MNALRNKQGDIVKKPLLPQARHVGVIGLPPAMKRQSDTKIQERTTDQRPSVVLLVGELLKRYIDLLYKP